MIKLNFVLFYSMILALIVACLSASLPAAEGDDYNYLSGLSEDGANDLANKDGILGGLDWLIKKKPKRDW